MTAATESRITPRRIEIVRYTAGNLELLPHPEQPFDVIGRLVPRYDGESFTVSEKLYDTPTLKTYPDENYDPSDYIENKEQAAFLAMADGVRAGSVRVCRRWNGNGFIDDLKVDRAYRHSGIGTMLMNAALEWSRENDLNGLSLETQDNNLYACRFYLKYGFILGGIDGKVYTHPDYKNETALYFYLPDNLYHGKTV